MCLGCFNRKMLEITCDKVIIADTIELMKKIVSLAVIHNNYFFISIFLSTLHRQPVYPCPARNGIKSTGIYTCEEKETARSSRSCSAEKIYSAGIFAISLISLLDKHLAHFRVLAAPFARERNQVWRSSRAKRYAAERRAFVEAEAQNKSAWTKFPGHVSPRDVFSCKHSHCYGAINNQVYHDQADSGEGALPPRSFSTRRGSASRNRGQLVFHS